MPLINFKLVCIGGNWLGRWNPVIASSSRDVISFYLVLSRDRIRKSNQLAFHWRFRSTLFISVPHQTLREVTGWLILCKVCAPSCAGVVFAGDFNAVIPKSLALLAVRPLSLSLSLCVCVWWVWWWWCCVCVCGVMSMCVCVVMSMLTAYLTPNTCLSTPRLRYPCTQDKQLISWAALQSYAATATTL